jgi:hypothetical protein
MVLAAAVHTTESSAATASEQTFRSDTPGVHVTETALQKSSPAAGKLFTRHYGEEFGLVANTDVPLSYKFTSPFQRSGPVASADIDGDGWIDLVFGTDKGLLLYRNIQGKRFEQLPLRVSGERTRVFNTALVDLNNDRLPDLYFSLYRGGNHIIFNSNGTLRAEGLVSLPVVGPTFSSAAAFGDLDLDGDIDIALGNWTAGPWTRIPGESSRNVILWKEDSGYRAERLPGFPGETLSMLISDINQDGFPDLMVGNDFEIPESYYLGQAGGKLRLIKRSDNLFPVTTFSTMSIDSGDIDNDLNLEIYATQASGFTSTLPTNRASMLPLQTTTESCDEYENNEWRTRCLVRLKQHQIIHEAQIKRNPRLCLEMGVDSEIRGCLSHLLLIKSTRFDRDPKICVRLEKNWPNLAYICKAGHQPIPRYSQELIREKLRQQLGRNMLYSPTRSGAYTEVAEAMDADITGWSWTARFADLDNDEWQDIYIVNGRFSSPKRATNVFFRNERGKRFANATRDAGLENYLSANCYTYVDYDNDADLDIVVVTNDGPIWVYTNNTQNGAGIIFELDDSKGNRAGIGGRIIIHYGPDGSKHQIREIKASGGFLSYDAPRAHFGLGEHNVVSRVEVIWSTGETTELSGKFRGGHKYLIGRTGG